MNEPMKKILQLLTQAWLDDPDNGALMPRQMVRAGIGAAPQWCVALLRDGWIQVAPGKGFAITAAGIRALAADESPQS